MSIEFNIEKIIKRDLLDIENIGKKSLPIYYSSSDLYFLLMDSNYLLYKASNKNTIYGFIVVKLTDNKKKAHIMTIAVLENYRRNGIGTKLINMLKKKNIEKISLHALETNLDALSFYKQNKFIITEKILNYYEKLDQKNGLYLCYIK